jgi:hypothetical protein
MITSEQVQAARALLRWEQKGLAATLKVSLPSIKRLENRCHPHSPRIGRRRIHRREWRRSRRAAKENQTENKMTKDNSEERETICLVSDPASRGGPTIKGPPGYFTPPSEPAYKVAITADLNNALMEATIKELEKLDAISALRRHSHCGYQRQTNCRKASTCQSNRPGDRLKVIKYNA